MIHSYYTILYEHCQLKFFFVVMKSLQKDHLMDQSSLVQMKIKLLHASVKQIKFVSWLIQFTPPCPLRSALIKKAWKLYILKQQ